MKKIYFVIIFLLLNLNIFAQNIDLSKLPKLLGSNNIGKEFYFTFIPAWEGNQDDIILYISSNVRTKVVVSMKVSQYEKVKYTVPNDIIEFNLSPSQGQAYRKTDRSMPEPDQVWKGAGIHVLADDPIICYGVTRYAYSSDGFLALPVNTLGKEYTVATYPDPSNNKNQWLPAYTGITAAYDKTNVTFTMGGTNSSKTASHQLPGETSKWNLNAGDVLLFASLGSQSDLSGSIISATKPVSVVSGNFSTYIPTTCGYAEITEEMELPTSIWGKEYHVTRIVNRQKNSFIKIFAKESKTKIYRDFSQIGYIRTAGGVEGVGHLHIRADEGNPRPIVISGDKPINVTQYNTGQQDDNIVSDPFQMVLVPTEQYQKEITFNTPGIRGGFGFPQNFLNIIYEANENGGIPDDIEFASVIGGQFSYQQLNQMTANPGNPFAKSPTSKNYYHKTIVLPSDGVYKMRAKKPFQAYLYGFSSYDSYGFPASASLKNLSVNDSLPPVPNWVMDCKGNVNEPENFATSKWKVKDLPEQKNFRSNLSLIYMHSGLSYNYQLLLGDFMPGDSQSTKWALQCIDNSQDARAVVTFSDRAGNDTSLVLEYLATKIKLTNYDLGFGFGNLKIGDTIETQFNLVNFDTISPWNCTNLKLLKNNAGFSLWQKDGKTPISFSDKNPLKIQPLDSFTFIVRFTATQEGNFWDSIGFGDNCNFWYKYSVDVNVGSPIMLVSDWSFAPINVGARAYAMFNIRNVGSVNLDIDRFEGPFTIGNKNGMKIFGFPTPGMPDEKFPMSIKPNEIRNFEIWFSPDDTIKYPDSIVFISNTAKVRTNGFDSDSVCYLNGSALFATLEVNSYDWGRRRIDRPTTHPVPAYPPPADIITLFNPVNNAITINKVNLKIINGSASSFQFTPADFYITLNTSEKKVIPISFKPTATGLHEIELEFVTDKTIDGTPYSPLITATSNLRGTGIVPKTEIDNPVFTRTKINDTLNPSKMICRIKNLGITDGWEFCDSVTIADFTGKNISTNINNWDDGLPFRYDKSKIIFPIIIQPDSLFEFEIEFCARKSGAHFGSLTTISDAESEVTSIWSGYDLDYVGVEENKIEKQIQINPTPAVNFIEIKTQLTQKEIDGINIYNHLGQRMNVGAHSNVPLRLDVSHLPNGIYFLRIKNEFHKIIIWR